VDAPRVLHVPAKVWCDGLEGIFRHSCRRGARARSARAPRCEAVCSGTAGPVSTNHCVQFSKVRNLRGLWRSGAGISRFLDSLGPESLGARCFAEQTRYEIASLPGLKFFAFRVNAFRFAAAVSRHKPGHTSAGFPPPGQPHSHRGESPPPRSREGSGAQQIRPHEVTMPDETTQSRCAESAWERLSELHTRVSVAGWRGRIPSREFAALRKLSQWPKLPSRPFRKRGKMM